ncbi:protein kinase family protein [Mycobacteroides abscessus]|uniref:protein kinase family protein n=1 Tax=Mycobacteroides abscessus TaxID=36809 RepID=UPI000C25F57F|nr:protein kinase family protein [Mycobacteroides abscessus]
MIEDAATIIALIQNAPGPTDVFGPHSDNPADIRAAKRTFRIYANAVHPDRARATGISAPAAAAAFARLTELHGQWQHVKPNREGEKAAKAKMTITSAADVYTLGACIARGAIANIYRAHNRAAEVVAVKIPRAVASSSFLDNEQQALGMITTFCAVPENNWLTPYYPKLLDTATHRSAAGENRTVNVLSDLSPRQGFVTLAEVKDAIPEGLDGRDWAWIFRRLLRAVSGAHLMGLVHGAILPDNILIHPEGHGVVLAGWSFTTTAGLPVKGKVHSRKDFYPPDADTEASSATDVYMAAAVMQSMLKPNEHAQLRFARGCMQNAPRLRPSAVSLMGEYDDLLESLYGKRTFRRFPYTITAATTA